MACQKLRWVMRPVIVALLLLMAINLAPRSLSLALSASPTPFIGASVVTYMARDLAPQRAAHALARYRIVSTWAVADASHWRLDSRTLAPALQRHDETVVANGMSLIWYKSIFNRAWRMPLGGGATLGTLGFYQGGSLVATIQGMGRAYLSDAQRQGERVRALGRQTLLGRAADVFEIRPLDQGSAGEQGWFRLWLDHQSPLVLRLELHGLGRQSSEPRRWIYRVTSLTFGTAPSRQALAYRPPVQPTAPPASRGSGGSGSAGPGVRWQVPRGFIPVDTPAGYTLTASGADEDPMWKAPSGIEALFKHDAAFVCIQEQVRVAGLPPALMRATPVAVGWCRLWTGRYSEKRLRWLALQRGVVSLLANSNRMSQAELVRFATRRICR